MSAAILNLIRASIGSQWSLLRVDELETKINLIEYIIRNKNSRPQTKEGNCQHKLTTSVSEQSDFITIFESKLKSDCL